MTSYLRWLDYSAAESRRMMEVVALFKESEARDELGLGAIRDGLADHFFPGTGTVQTRARYFFFAPWMYLELERKRTPSAVVAERARRQEVQLIEKLLASAERQGVIGREARSALKRLPSNIYWQGMHRLGILRYDGTQQQYHRFLDAMYQAQRQLGQRSPEDDEAPVQLSVWHPQLPPVPEGFPDGAGLDLAHPEAVFLRDQIELRAGESLFAWFAHRCGTEHDPPGEDDLWADALLEAYPARLKHEAVQAQNFAVLMHGAALSGHDSICIHQSAALPLIPCCRPATNPGQASHHFQERQPWHHVPERRMGSTVVRHS